RTIPRRHRVAPSAEGDSPVGDRACRVSREHSVERADRSAEFERVQQRYRTVELRLNTRVARGREMDGAEPFHVPGMAVLLRIGRKCRYAEKKCADYDAASSADQPGHPR